MTRTATYSAVRLGPNMNPSKGEVLLRVPATGQGIPTEIMTLWQPGKVAVVWSCTMELRQLSEAGLASVRKKRLRRRLDKDVPLFADQLEADAHAKRPEFFAGKRDEPSNKP